MRGRAYRWLPRFHGRNHRGCPDRQSGALYVFGLPFLLAWILACVLLTSA